VGWDLRDLLVSGFGGVNEKSRAGLRNICAVRWDRSSISSIPCSESAGAQAFANFATYLAPFIRYDKLTYKDVKQSLQEFLFNMNVPTRVGFQTPFTNVTLDLNVPGNVASEHVVIGGELMPETYGDFQAEMDIFNRAFSECLLEGDARNRIFTFPIPTYNVTKDFDWENANLDKLWEMTARYGIPYFANFVNSDMDPEDARSMCCRLRLDNRELRRRGGGLFGANPLTGSIGVVTINLPRLAYLSKDEQGFFERLAYLMDMARESLEIKRKVLENFTRQNLYPYTRHYLRDIYTRHGRYWVNHFSTIGLVGMNEASMNLHGCGVAVSARQGFRGACARLYARTHYGLSGRNGQSLQS
jgi:ribonucleoside-triphosphate reductase